MWRAFVVVSTCFVGPNYPPSPQSLNERLLRPLPILWSLTHRRTDTARTFNEGSPGDPQRPGHLANEVSAWRKAGVQSCPCRAKAAIGDPPDHAAMSASNRRLLASRAKPPHSFTHGSVGSALLMPRVVGRHPFRDLDLDFQWRWAAGRGCLENAESLAVLMDPDQSIG